MKTDYTLIDNTSEQRYEIDAEGHKAYIEYTRQPGMIILSHTFVPKPLEGKGIGSELVRMVLEEVKSKDWQVVPQCDFIAIYIRRHPEWEELIVKKTQKA